MCYLTFVRDSSGMQFHVVSVTSPISHVLFSRLLSSQIVTAHFLHDKWLLVSPVTCFIQVSVANCVNLTAVTVILRKFGRNH
ncbi:hypothetical protein OUZ56_020176 [Daphnia magna]|uniref:Uncharacterized protein n=1 Tax=Daphnia magna TaxID=35525 RepID=A0ABQ9ZDQ7_9CRUS|nr:hypothetical protein OUZ56_020176 [Daphnia magna]